jgi:DNA-directed RNA polymerase specialized sigma24 family protein
MRLATGRWLRHEPCQTVDDEPLEARVRLAIAGLSPRSRAIFDAVGRIPYAEIARRQDISIAEVERQFAYALAALDRAAQGDAPQNAPQDD